MSGTSYLYNKSISSDMEDLKRLQAQRDKLEKAALDYKSKGYHLETLTHENDKLKATLESLRRERLEIEAGLVKRVAHTEAELNVVEVEQQYAAAQLEKFQEYSAELEKNNDNWKKESEKQSSVLEGLIYEAEELNSKIKNNEAELCDRRESFNRAKLEQQDYIKLKHSLDRQRHNHQILDNDYNTFRKQNDDLKQYIGALEEERIKTAILVQKLEEESAHNKEDICREIETLQEELHTQKTIAGNHENFIDELRVEIDQLRKQNNYLKSKLELLD